MTQSSHFLHSKWNRVKSGSVRINKRTSQKAIECNESVYVCNKDVGGVIVAHKVSARVFLFFFGLETVLQIPLELSTEIWCAARLTIMDCVTQISI